MDKKKIKSKVKSKVKRINSRAKGASGERELAKFLSERGYEARRGQQFCGANGDQDVICEKLSRLSIECKRVQALNIDKALMKCVEDMNKGQIASVWHRRNGEQWKVTILAEDLIRMLDDGYLSLG